MANRKKKVYKPKPMTEGKRNIIQGLLQEYDIETAAGEVREVLEINKQERHIRGGQATKEKYLQQHRSHFNKKYRGTGSGSHNDQAFFPVSQQDCNDKSRCG